MTFKNFTIYFNLGGGYGHRRPGIIYWILNQWFPAAETSTDASTHQVSGGPDQENPVKDEPVTSRSGPFQTIALLRNDRNELGTLTPNS